MKSEESGIAEQISDNYSDEGFERAGESSNADKDIDFFAEPKKVDKQSSDAGASEIMDVYSDGF